MRLYHFALMLTTAACAPKTQPAPIVATPVAPPPLYYVDTITPEMYEDTTRHLWTGYLDNLLPLYRFPDSKKIAISFDMAIGNRKSILDSICQAAINQVLEESGLGELLESAFIHSPELQKQLTDLVGTSFYLHGTKGSMPAQVTQVAINYSQCRTDVSFYFDESVVNKIGFPIIASRRELTLSQHRPATFDTFVAQYLAYGPGHFDYFEDTPITYFAHTGDTLIAYTDTFGEMNFPSREFYIIDNNGTYRHVGGGGLDWFGIPCD